MTEDNNILEAFSEVTAEQIAWQGGDLLKVTENSNLTEDRMRVISSRIIGTLQALSKSIEQGNCDANMLAVSQMFLDSTTDLLKEEINATNDHLTGLLSRAGIKKFSEAQFSHAKRNGQEIGVFLLDLNKFKPINDELGHADGDKALQLCSKQIKENVRQEDSVSRYGGDEFVIVMTNDKNHDWRTQYNKLADLFDNLTYISDSGKEYPVGASIGFVIAEPDELPVNAISRADEEMYKVKEGGYGANEDLERNIEHTPPTPSTL